MENVSLRAINLPRIPYLERVVILYDTKNVNKDLPFDIAGLIEIGKYFEERSCNVKIIISSILA